MYSNSRRPNLKALGAKAVALGSSVALVATAFPVAALAAGVTPDGVTGNTDYNNTGKAIVMSESSDSWDSLYTTDSTGLEYEGLTKTENADGSVSYTGIVHSDLTHFTGYGLTTTITTDSNGIITAIDLSSGNETFAGSWGYKNTAKNVSAIEGYLPDGVTFQMTANEDGTYSPALSGADSYGYSIVSSGGYNKRTGQTTPTTYSITGYNATSADEATEVSDGVTYDADNNKITVNDTDAVNLIKVVWKIGGELTFNTYYALGSDTQKATAQSYVDNIQATTWDDDPDLTGTMGATNRNQWTAVMGTIYLQRELASWSEYLTNETEGEVDDLDTVSGATKTAEPFVEALNQSVLDGKVKGVAENVKITIDQGDNDAIDLNANPMDASTVTVNDNGEYVLNNDFPVGADRAATHGVTLDTITTYSLENATTADIAAIAKGRSSATALNTYNPKTIIGYEEDDGDPIYSEGWGDFVDTEGNIAVDYASTGAIGITLKDKSVTHVALTYTLGHGTITVVYDLAQTKAAGDVQAQIAALGDSPSVVDVAAARVAYDALSTDVKGFVSNIDSLETAETKFSSDDLEAAIDKVQPAYDVKATIAALGNHPSLTSVQAARTAYTNLADDIKGYVSNLDTLAAAEASFDLKTSEATVTLSQDSYTYSGKANKPTVTVESSLGATLTQGTDYTVSYKSNTNAGTATVTVTGAGDYTGTLSKTFTIAKASISKATVSVAKATYTGKALKPAVTVKVGGTTLKSGTDYTVAYKSNTNAGTATVTVTGKGNYSGTVSKKFTIAKAANTVKVKTTAKSVKLAKVKKAKQTVKAITVSGAKGTVTYAKKSGSSKLTVNKKTGKVTVKKGTKKGTYKAKVTVKAAGTTNYKSATKTVTVTVKVKK